jgi:hypothetical protein
VTERQVLDLLAARYVAPEWAFLRHVANGTGGHKSRTADGIAMNLWPSRGMELHGFEVKVYRGDWLREVKDPAKADEIAARCHRWWVVAGGESIVAQDDLFPQTWGLMVVRGGALVVAREAPLLAPAPLTWEFLAAILRRAAEAQTQPAPTPGAVARARGVDPVAAEDAAKLRGRLERLKSTVTRISNDVGNALYDLDREERRVKREAEVDEADDAPEAA